MFPKPTNQALLSVATLLWSQVAFAAGQPPHVLSIDLVRLPGPSAMLLTVPDGGSKSVPRDEATAMLAKAVNQAGKPLVQAKVDVVSGEKVVPYRKAAIRTYVERVADSSGETVPHPRTLQTGLSVTVTPDGDGKGYGYEWKDMELVGPDRGFRTESLPDGTKTQSPVLADFTGRGHVTLPWTEVTVQRSGDVLAFLAWD